MMPDVIKHTSRNVIFVFMTVEKVYSIFYKKFSNVFFRAKNVLLMFE